MPGPLFRGLVRVRLRTALRRKGYSFGQAWDMVDEAEDDVLDELITTAAEQTNAVAAIGDGKLLQALLDWLKSEQGAAFLDALLKLLLAMIGGL